MKNDTLTTLFHAIEEEAGVEPEQNPNLILLPAGTKVYNPIGKNFLRNRAVILTEEDENDPRSLDEAWQDEVLDMGPSECPNLFCSGTKKVRYDLPVSQVLLEKQTRRLQKGDEIVVIPLCRQCIAVLCLLLTVLIMMI